jgi:hypothetical protein
MRRNAIAARQRHLCPEQGLVVVCVGLAGRASEGEIMSAENNFSDWMSASGCRRQPCRRAPQSADLGARTGAADGPGQAKPSPAAPEKPPVRRGLIHWGEFFRGALLLGIFGGTIWVEWMAIKSLAAYCTQFFGS